MTIKLSSLRVTAEMNASQYLQAAKQIGAASDAASASVKAVGQSLAAVDAAASKTAPGVASLSRVWITGYGEAAKFEAAVRRVGSAMDRGMDAGRAAAALDNVYRKFGQTADAATLAKQGFTALAPVVSALNDRYETTAAIADRAAASTKRLADAQRAQQQINSSLGVREITGGTARSSADAFLAGVGGLDGAAAAQARQIADSFNAELNARLVAGTGKSARDAASVFSAELDRLDTIAKQKAEQAGAEFGRALNASLIRGQGKSASESASVFVEQENAVQKLRVEFDQLSVAQERRAASEAQINKFAAAGLVGEQQRITMLDAVNRRYEDTAAALARTQVPLGKYVSGVGLARNELINLSRQAQDVFVSLASGQSPLTVLIQQGTQIADVFAASRGSIGGFLVQLGAWLLPLAPALLATAAGVTALYAAFSVASQKQELANSLLGIGRAAGITGEELNKLAKESAAAGEVSVSAARSMAAEYTKTGKIGPAVMRDLIRVSKDYAATTGQDVPEAVKDLAASFADPIKGMETLNAKLGTLGPATQRAVRDAVGQNDAYRAQKILVDALASSTERAANATTFWGRAWDKLKTSASNGIDAVGERLGESFDPSKQQQLNKILAERADLQRRLSAPGGVPFASGGSAQGLRQQDQRLAQEEASLRRQIELQQEAAKAAQERVKTTSDLNAAEAKSKDYNAEKSRIDDLRESVTALRRGYDSALSSLDKAVAKGDVNFLQSQQFTDEINRVAEFKKNLDTATKQLGEFAGAQAKGGLESEKAARALDIQSQFTGKISAAQQGELAAQLKLNELRGSAVSESQRQAEAERARTAARLEGIRADAEASASAKYGIDTLTAQTKAIKDQGLAAGETAEIRARVAKETGETGGDFERRLAEETAAALARVVKERTENNAKLQEAAALERKLNADVAAGRTTLAQAAQQLQINQAVEENTRKLRALGVNDNKAIAASNREITAAVSARLSVEQQRAALGILENQNQTIQGLEREISLIGQSTAVRRIELEILQAKQQLQQQGIAIESREGQEIVARARRIGELNNQLDATRKAYDGIKQAQDFVADGFKAFAEELITGTEGINGALKTLGKGFLSASLDALISGKGPLAASAGLASNDNTKQGGIIGLLSGNSLKPLTDAVAKGAEKGSEAGTVGGFSLFSGGSGNILGIDGKQLAGGLTAIAGLAGAYGIGQSAGSAAQAVGGGAISGGVAGLSAASALGMSASVLGPIGAIAGGALAYFGNQQKKKAEKAERQRVAQENYQNAQADIASFRSQARGEPQDTLATRIRDAETSARKLADVAFLAGKASEATAIWADGQTYIMRGISEFKDGFAGLVASLTDGMGPSGPFATAKGNIKSLGDEMKAFIASTAKAFGDDDPAVSQARNAAASYALTVFEGAKSLSATATRMQEIQGTAAGLSKVLQDLGWSADSAAAAVSAGLAGAIARLKESFEAELVAKTNEKGGSGYLNDVTQLLSEVATLRADAASLGTDQGLVTNYFSAAAQEIVNGANLTGQAFSDLLARFPGLIGYVREAGFVINDTARLIEAAARRISYQDRIFNALNDNSTLAGQLAAFDRNAQRERAEEIRLGGDAINELEGALAAERLKIITDFANSAAEEQKRALEEAQNFFDTFSRNLRQFVDGLRSGSDSPLSPEARLAAAQGQYNAQLALAQGGDRDAINGLTTYASALLEAGEAFYASSAGYQQIFDQVTTQLLALPTQVSAEQFIVDAIENAANATISAIDTNGDGFISLQEATNANLGSIFRELDLNGDGQISALELIRGATRDTANSANYQNTILAQTQNIVSASNNLLASANSIASAQESLLAQIRALNGTQQSTLEALRGQFGLNNVVGINGLTLNNNMVEALNKIVFNTANTVIGQKAGAAFTYASGGWVSGPGTGTSDSIAARLSNGEFVVNARAANENRDLLEQINGGSGRFDALAVSVPQPIGLPVLSSGGGSASETRMLREELRAVRQELSDIKRAVVAGAMHVREGVDAGTSVQREAVRETKFKKKAA